jgi:hypothetical protein
MFDAGLLESTLMDGGFNGNNKSVFAYREVRAEGSDFDGYAGGRRLANRGDGHITQRLYSVIPEYAP